MENKGSCWVLVCVRVIIVWKKKKVSVQSEQAFPRHFVVSTEIPDLSACIVFLLTLTL